MPKKEYSTARWFFGNVFNIARKHGNTFIFWVGFGYCFRQAALAVRAFAGQVSSANLAFSLLANVSVQWAVSISVSGLAVTLYIRERSLHRKTRERLTARTGMLELRLDRNRTSSHLTPRGQTQKEDE